MALRDVGLDPLHKAKEVGRKEQVFALFVAFLHHPLHKEASDLIEKGLLLLTPRGRGLQVYLQTLLDERVFLNKLLRLQIAVQVDSHKAIVLIQRLAPYYLIMWKVVQHLEEEGKAGLCHFEVGDVLVDDLDLLVFDQMRVGLA